MAQAQISNAFTVSVDGTALPADLEPLLVSADVDDSLNLPDLVILRFRDAERTVLAKTNLKIGAKLVIAASSKASTSPEPLITAEATALEAEFDATGTFTLLEVECLGACDRAPVVMVNDDWHECLAPERAGQFVRELRATGPAVLSGCHLHVEGRSS